MLGAAIGVKDSAEANCATHVGLYSGIGLAGGVLTVRRPASLTLPTTSTIRHRNQLNTLRQVDSLKPHCGMVRALQWIGHGLRCRQPSDFLILQVFIWLWHTAYGRKIEFIGY